MLAHTLQPVGQRLRLPEKERFLRRLDAVLVIKLLRHIGHNREWWSELMPVIDVFNDLVFIRLDKNHDITAVLLQEGILNAQAMDSEIAVRTTGIAHKGNEDVLILIRCEVNVIAKHIFRLEAWCFLTREQFGYFSESMRWDMRRVDTLIVLRVSGYQYSKGSRGQLLD